jgi:hypothetical protein
VWELVKGKMYHNEFLLLLLIDLAKELLHTMSCAKRSGLSTLEGDEDEEDIHHATVCYTNPVSLPECTSEECRTGQGTN